MARILFVCLYGEFGLGVRQLVSNVRKAGHQADLLCLKQYKKRVLDDDEKPRVEWQVELMANGKRSVLCYPFEITSCERQLVTDLMRRLNPDVVGISAYTPQLVSCIEVTELVREALPDTTLIWGGPHATLDPVGSSHHADYVMMGECDYTIIELMETLDKGGDLGALSSMCHRKDGKLVRNPIGPVPQNLDELPFTYHGTEGVYYCDNDTLTEGVPFPTSDLWTSHKIMTSRGCPYSCSYCMLSYQKEVMPDSTKLRYRSINHVIDELAGVLERRGNYFCEIEDDIFTMRPERMEDFFDEYKARVDMPFWCYTHPQYARDSMLSLLRENNAQFVVMGIESGSNRVANEVFNRKTNMQSVIEAAHRIKANGLRVFYDFISNNPFETDEDKTETFHLIRALPKPFEVQVGSLNFYPNIHIDRMRKAQGLPAETDFNENRFWNSLYHLASAIDISDEDANHYLTEPFFQSHPEFMEGLAAEAKRIAHGMNNAELLCRNLELEVQRQAKRAGDAENALVYATHRRGFSQFVAVSESLRRMKLNLVGDGPKNGASNGVDVDAQAAACAAQAAILPKASNRRMGHDDIVVEVTRPLDFRDAEEDSRDRAKPREKAIIAPES